MFQRSLTALALLLTVCLSSSAWAHDLVPPPWRGEATTAYAHWEFNTGANPAVPEQLDTPFGDAMATMTLGPFASGWLYSLPAMGTQIGFWDLGSSGSIVATVDGPVSEVDSKELWVQVAYYEDLHVAPEVSIDVTSASLQSEQTLLVESIKTGGAWYVHQSVWLIDPVTSQESIDIVATMSGAVIDQVVVDLRVNRHCNDPFADADGDGDVDQSDFGAWQSCLTGQAGGLPEGCLCFDRDNGGAGDGDIDIDDLDAFELCASGPAVPADPSCDD